MRRFFVLLAISMIALSGCAKKADVAAEEEALRKADADWSAAMGTKNMDDVMAYVADDAVFMPPNMPAVSGAEAVRSFMGNVMGMPGFSLSWTPTNVEVASSGDLGYTTGTYQATMGMPDGTTVPENGKYAAIWKKQADGSWKVVVDVFNSDMPMPTPQTTAPADTAGAPGQ